MDLVIIETISRLSCSMNVTSTTAISCSLATHHQNLRQMVVKIPRLLFLKCDYVKISTKHAFSLVALSRIDIHKSVPEGCMF